MASQRQVGLDAVLLRDQPQLGQASGCGGEVVTLDVGQRGPPPEVQRLAQEVAGGLRVPVVKGLSAAAGEPLERDRVDAVGVGVEHVARRL